MRNKLFLLLAMLATAGCSTFRYDPGIPLQCDAISAVGIESYRTLESLHRTAPVAKGELDLYSAGTLSRFQFSEIKNESPVRIDKVYAYQRPGLPELNFSGRSKDYALFFIPPGTSAKALAQWGMDPETRSKSIDYPAFIAVPEQSIIEKKCRPGAEAFLVASIENESFNSLPQVIVSPEALEAMVNAFYVDKRSSDPQYLRKRIEEAKNGFVNENVWRGWIKLEVTKRSRGFWAKWQDAPDDGDLTDDHLGLPIDTLSAETTNAALQNIDASELSKEMNFIAAGWFGKIGAYDQALSKVAENISKLESDIRSGTMTSAAFQKAVQTHVAATEAASKELSAFQATIEAQRPWFVTPIEGELYLEALQASLDDLQDRFNRIAAAYADATRLANMQTIDPALFLDGSPVTIEGEMKQPLRKSFAKAERSLGTNIRVDTVGFARPAAQGKYIITVRGLIGITDLLNSASGYLRNLIKSKGSCSKHIGSIRLNTGETVEPDQFVRRFEVDLESRTCWKVFGTRGWTRNFSATARGRVHARVRHLGDGDIALGYGWRAMARVLFFTLGDKEDWAVGSVRQLVAQKDLNTVKQYGLAVKEAGFVKDKTGKAYLAVSIDTKPLSGSEALVAYSLLNATVVSDK